MPNNRKKWSLFWGLVALNIILVLVYSSMPSLDIKAGTKYISSVTYINASDRLKHYNWSSILDTVTSGGVCVLDANNDSRQDLFFPGLGDLNTDRDKLPGYKLGNSLYINRGNDKNKLPIFEDVTDKAGIRNIGKLGVGCVVADYDNDGREDILVTNATKGVLYSAYGNLDPTGSGVKVKPPSFFHTDLTDGKYNFPEEGGVTLFHNDGIDENGVPHFTDVTLKADLTRGGNSTSAAWADVNNDGFIDLFVGNYSDFDFAGFTETHFPGGYNVLYKNNGDGTFSDVSDQAGIKGEPEFVYTLAGEKQYAWSKDIRDSKGRMVGDPAGNTLAVSFTDYNNDGLPDLITASDIPGRIRLYQNLGNFKFKEVSKENDFGSAGDWMGIAIGDIDNDGNEDVFATNMGGNRGSRYRQLSSGQTLMIDILNPPNKATFYNGLWVYKNNSFKNVSKNISINWGEWQPNIRWFPPKNIVQNTSAPKPIGLELGEFGFGTVIFDYDNDGREDLAWIGSLGRSLLLQRLQLGTPDIGNPGRLLKNFGDNHFADVSIEAGFSNLTNPNDRTTYQNGRGLAVGDFNNDGYYDVVLTNSGGWDSANPQVPDLKNIGMQYAYVGLVKQYEPGPTFLYISSGGKNNWLKLKLVGVKSNASAIGAKITIEYKESGVAKNQIREIRAGESYASQNSLEPIFGLGKVKKIDKLIIDWPNGQKETITNVKSNQRLVIKEK